MGLMLINCFRGRSRDNSSNEAATSAAARALVSGRQALQAAVDAAVATTADDESDTDSKRDVPVEEQDLERRAMMFLSMDNRASVGQRSSIDRGFAGDMAGVHSDRGGGGPWWRILSIGRRERKRDRKNKGRGLMMLAASLKEREKEWERERERHKKMNDNDAHGFCDAHEKVDGSFLENGPLSKRPRSRSQVARTVEKEALRETSRAIDWMRKREMGGWGAAGVGILNDDVEAWAEGKSLKMLDEGQYLEMDRARSLVRSTICIAFSHDEKFFASTHGDHTVKIWNYPDVSLFNVLEGHPRTPWTVKFHPSNSYIVASGCLGKTCRVWDIRTGVCLYQQGFGSSISCLAFHPAGNVIAITSGRSLELWNYSKRGGIKLLRRGTSPYHMVDFHPSGDYILSGVKNTPQGAPEANDAQFTLRLTMDHFDEKKGIIRGDNPPLIIARAIAYNDAGTHFSPCGRMLVVCIPLYSWKLSFQIAVLALPTHTEKTGTILSHTPLDANRTIALTNLKFSSSSHHLLAGYSFRRSNPVLRQTQDGYVPVVDIYRLGKCLGSPAKIIKRLKAAIETESGETQGSVQDEINVAIFGPGKGYSCGVIYGTQKGRIRVYKHEPKLHLTSNLLELKKEQHCLESISSDNVITSNVL